MLNKLLSRFRKPSDPKLLVLQKKAKVGEILTGLTVGQALVILSDLLSGLLAQDISSAENVQAHAQDLSALSTEMVREDFLFLLAAALNSSLVQIAAKAAK